MQSKLDAVTWFLNDDDDVRSSNFLEDTATEFDIQGLELDWAVVCWDANYRFNHDHFEYFKFTGTRWTNIKKEENANFLKNSYRVILTRARQGFIIFVPPGNPVDPTRSPKYYDGIYSYLRNVGIKEL